MQFREQYYTNKRRIYYHGSKEKDLNLEYSRFPWFFITTNLYYAIGYAKAKYQDYGFVFSFNLAEKLNIWNGQSKIDYELVKNKLNYLTSRDLKYLKEGLDLTMLDFDRKQFVEDLVRFGYDGFFNFEYTKWTDKRPINKNYNAIGIFNIEKLIKRNKYTFEDLMIKSEEFCNTIESQYNACVRECTKEDLLGKGKNMSAVYGLSEKYLLLPVSEIQYIIEHEKPIKLEEQKIVDHGNLIAEYFDQYEKDQFVAGKKLKI